MFLFRFIIKKRFYHHVFDRWCNSVSWFLFLVSLCLPLYSRWMWLLPTTSAVLLWRARNLPCSGASILYLLLVPSSNAAFTWQTHFFCPFSSLHIFRLNWLGCLLNRILKYENDDKMHFARKAEKNQFENFEIKQRERDGKLYAEREKGKEENWAEWQNNPEKKLIEYRRSEKWQVVKFQNKNLENLKLQLQVVETYRFLWSIEEWGKDGVKGRERALLQKGGEGAKTAKGGRQARISWLRGNELQAEEMASIMGNSKARSVQHLLGNTEFINIFENENWNFLRETMGKYE